MALKLYLFSLVCTLLLALFLLLLLFFSVNPFLAPVWIIILFYLTFFLIWASTFALVGFYLKVWATNREVIFAHLLPTLRQAIFMSITITGLLFLKQIGVLNWWIGGMLALSMALVELFFRSRK